MGAAPRLHGGGELAAPAKMVMAKAHAAKDDYAKAVELQTEAVDMSEGRQKQQFQQDLDKYKEKAKGGTSKDKAKSDAFVKRMLDDYGFVIRNSNFPVPGQQAEHYGVRVSTHLWSNMGDVDQLVDAMWELAGKMHTV